MRISDWSSDVCSSDLFVSDILSEIVALDGQEPATGKRAHIDSLLDLACGSGSLLLNVRNRMGAHGIGKIYGQETNITTYNLARMRSEERRVGKECVSTFRSRWSADHSTKKIQHAQIKNE